MHIIKAHGRARRAAGAVTAAVVAACGLATAYGPAATAASHTVVRYVAKKTAAEGRSAPVARAAVPGVSAGAVAAAQRAARASGHPAVIAAATSATDQTLANPNGSFTLLRHALPVRAHTNGAWVPVSAALRRNPGGTFSPAAVNGRLVFSGGGRGPLVSMADASGHALTLWWPTALPAPAISGATATYRSVLPGVDLRLTASTEGGFSDLLVVRTAAAAHDKALRILRLRVRTTRLRLSTGRAGNLVATDSATGATVFAAPPSALWDSASVRASPPARALAAGPAASSAAGPGRGAHRAIINVSVGRGTLSLAPPASVLAGARTVYPVYIDPSVTLAREAWTYVAQAYPNQAYLNSPYNDGHARVGYDAWTNTSNLMTRSYFQIGSFSGLAHDDIVNATLALTQTAASCTSCTFTMDTQLSGPINGSTTWNNQPGWDGFTVGASVSGNAVYNLNVTAGVQWFVNALPGSNGLTFVVYENGTNEDDYRFLANNPTVSVTYWSIPAVPWALATTPNLNEGLGQPLSACDTTAPGGWVNKTAGASIQLSASTSTPDTGYPLWIQYVVGQNGAAPGAGPASSSSYNAVPGTNTLRAPLTVTDGARYEYYAYATNGHTSSANSAPCYFRVDETPPSAPGAPVTQGNNQFRLSATDPGPNPSGVAGFNYNLDGASLVSTGEQTVAASGGSAAITLPATTRWGTHSLWLQSIDNAGNVSTPQLYTWYDPAPASPSPGTVGDVDGDGHPDLVAVDAAGAIRVYSNPLATSPDSTSSSAPLDQKYGGVTLLTAHSPGWPYASFTGAIVTHAGSFTSNQTVDDLIIWQNGNLYIAQNTDNGLQAGWTFTSGLPKPACSSCGASYNGQDWSSVTAMVALAPAAAGGRPSLLTLEYFNGAYGLWLYPPQQAGLGFAAPTLISSNTTGWDWSAMTLISPGQVSGGGHTLWVRDTHSGNLYQFTDIEAGIPNPATSAVQIGGGFTADKYPVLASDGDVAGTGHPDLWALTSATATPAQTLEDFPGTAPSGGQAFGQPIPVSAAGWGANIVSLENNIAAYNAPGLISDGATDPAASFDGDGTDYSAQALAAVTLASGYCSQQPADWATAQPCDPAAGVAPASLIQTPSAGTFQFPAAGLGVFDNYSADGQVVPAPTAVNYPARTISFLGGSTNVNGEESSGTATITYTDGSTEQITIGEADWLPKSATTNTALAHCTYRDYVTSGGHTESTPADLNVTPAYPLNVPAGQQIASVTLPRNTNTGQIHIFAIAVN